MVAVPLLGLIAIHCSSRLQPPQGQRPTIARTVTNIRHSHSDAELGGHTPSVSLPTRLLRGLSLLGCELSGEVSADLADSDAAAGAAVPGIGACWMQLVKLL